ncbi:inter-alpha-trypsin inhibitor heavy chain H3-like [Ylistrum balloti]|uniref:inter-alpha-trypsin inhibitor heavy chain H3-like n=1 Tax=Ylistrum balloti TaxID=509963 RepID=UPI0029059A4B|nr:inter-alpha-trypsin inhibitor heavy chain H3-like [Ylistrum balloti]
MELRKITTSCLFYMAIVSATCAELNNIIDGFQKGPTITSLHIRSDIHFRFATTTVYSSISNADIADHETTFDVTLPDAAYITNFTLEIGGVIYPGVIKEREAAKSQYDKAKKKGQSAGHISTNKPRDTNRFKVSVNVAAQDKIKFTLTYNELLQRRRGSYDHTIYIRPRQIVNDFRVEVYIQDSRQITHLRVPPLRDDVLINYNSIEQNRLARVSRPSSTSAHIIYEPSAQEQSLVSQQGLSGLFVVEYDVDRRLDAGDVVVVNGYFVHFFAPYGLERMRRRILFVLDTSGSMVGTKMKQLQTAMIEILDDLSEEDKFNIIKFHGGNQKWQDGMSAVPVTEESIASAKAYVRGMIADGWTNIDGAVMQGIEDALKDNTDDSIPIVIFLTDGDATAGETNVNKILTNIRTRNTEGVPVFSLAFGDRADFDFLKRLSLQNNGFARKIYEASDADLQLTGFYDEVSSVLVSNVTFRYLDDTVIKNTISNVIFPNYFEGSEIVVTGQLMDTAMTDLPVSIIGESSNGLLELRSSGNTILNDVDMTSFEDDTRPNVNFTDIAEKIWAYVTIKQLLDDRLRETNQTIRDEIKERATQLALKYNFVTPLTSMVVTKPEEETMVDPEEEEETTKSTWQAGPNPGQALIGKSPSFVDSDPHFIVHVKGLDTSVCFDIMGQPGDRINLVSDDVSGISVTAAIISNKKKPGSRRKRKDGLADQSKDITKTYLGEIRIEGLKTKLSFTPTNWTMDGQQHTWRSSEALKSHRTKVVTDGTGQQIAIIFPNKVLLLVIRHMRTKSQLRMGKVPFLGFYIVEEKGFSWHTHGILGQLLHRRISLKKTKKVDGKTRGKLLVRGNTKKTRKLTATLGTRLNLATNRETPCWMVQRNGKKLLDGSYKDYLVRDKNSTVTTKRKGRRKRIMKTTSGSQ